MKIHTVKYSRYTEGNNGGAGAVQQRNPEPAAGRGGRAGSGTEGVFRQGVL